MSKFCCPNCGQNLKVIPQRGVGSNSSSREFESVSKRISFARPESVPRGWLSSLLWFFRGGKVDYSPARPGSVTVRVETWNHADNQVKFDDMDSRVTFSIVQDVARMIERGHDWTRDNLVRHTSLSENKTRVIVREFKRLGYIEVTPNNRTVVTSQGRRFLRGVLAMSPPAGVVKSS